LIVTVVDRVVSKMAVRHGGDGSGTGGGVFAGGSVEGGRYCGWHGCGIWEWMVGVGRVAFCRLYTSKTEGCTYTCSPQNIC